MNKPKDIIAVYESPEDLLDKYTVVLDESWEANAGFNVMIGLSEDPTGPLGFSQLTEGMDGPHLGKLIEFESLPNNLQAHIIRRLK